MTVICIDSSCVLLPPRREPEKLANNLVLKIISCLTAQYNATARSVCAALPEKIAQWGQVHIVNGGDLIWTSTLGG